MAGLALDDDERAMRRVTHQTIDRVTRDIDPRMHLNTAVSAVMELVNELYAFCRAARRAAHRAATMSRRPSIVRPETAAVLREAIEALVLLLSPFTPHLSEELWERLGHADGIVAAGWPVFDAAAALEDAIEIPVQVNGKLRATRDAAARVERGRDSRARPSARRRSRRIWPAWRSSRSWCANGRLVSIVVEAGEGVMM